MKQRKFLTRLLASIALIAIYVAGTSAFMAASMSPVAARGRGGRGGGWGRGGGRGWGRGRGRGWGGGWGGLYVGAPLYYYSDPVARCYWSRRWRRTVCRY